MTRIQQNNMNGRCLRILAVVFGGACAAACHCKCEWSQVSAVKLAVKVKMNADQLAAMRAAVALAQAVGDTSSDDTDSDADAGSQTSAAGAGAGAGAAGAPDSGPSVFADDRKLAACVVEEQRDLPRARFQQPQRPNLHAAAALARDMVRAGAHHSEDDVADAARRARLMAAAAGKGEHAAAAGASSTSSDDDAGDSEGACNDEAAPIWDWTQAYDPAQRYGHDIEAWGAWQNQKLRPVCVEGARAKRFFNNDAGREGDADTYEDGEAQRAIDEWAHSVNLARLHYMQASAREGAGLRLSLDSSARAAAASKSSPRGGVRRAQRSSAGTRVRGSGGSAPFSHETWTRRTY